MKIAFTTSDHERINAHFGSAKMIDVYEVSAQGYQFVETLTFDGNLQEDGNEDKLTPKVNALMGCTIIYVSAIGGSAAARLIHKQVTPIKGQTEADDIKDTLDRFVKTLNGSPPPWLRKALQKKPRSFEEVEESETQEEVQEELKV